jgi:lipid II:glycine glycyltransferase (peptidoglycan interpeptide bridge formation enzyme)
MSLIECVAENEVTSFAAEPKVAHCIEPLNDGRWNNFVQKHPRASLFHSPAWLESLSRTYGYKPIAYTTSAAGQKLENAVVLCKVESWLTGRRLVSLPFSDHCEPLVDRPEDMGAIATALEQEFRNGRWRYIEMRPLQELELATSLEHATIPYTFHQLDLRPDVDTLFRNCHKNSTQRKIRRAEREGLQYREGSSEEFLDYFFALHAITRKRHHRPPQPRKWFVNLRECFGKALTIRVAFKEDRPIAAMLSIQYKDTMVYKYGGSDARFNNLGSMHLLLWRAIQEAKSDGLHFFDFGRTEASQQGLITFKQRWGTTQSELIYSRYGVSGDVSHMFESSSADWRSKAAKYLLAHMQPSVLSLAGRALYKHVG